MSKNFGYFGNGIDGYIHYNQSFDDNFGDDGNEDFDEFDDEFDEDYDDFEDNVVYGSSELSYKIKLTEELCKLSTIITERSYGRLDTIELIDEFQRKYNELVTKFKDEAKDENLKSLLKYALKKKQDIIDIFSQVKDDELKNFEVLYLSHDCIDKHAFYIKGLENLVTAAILDLPNDIDNSKLKEYIDILNDISMNATSLVLGLIRKFIDKRQIANLQAYAETLKEIELPYSEIEYEDFELLAGDIGIAVDEINQLLELSRQNVMSGKIDDKYFIDDDDDSDDDDFDDDDNDFGGGIQEYDAQFQPLDEDLDDNDSDIDCEKTSAIKIHSNDEKPMTKEERRKLIAKKIIFIIVAVIVTIVLTAYAGSHYGAHYQYERSNPVGGTVIFISCVVTFSSVYIGIFDKIDAVRDFFKGDK